MSKEVTLCVSNAYQKKFYLNENFNELPQSIREELKIMCVLYTEDIGGILELVFDEEGNLQFKTSCADDIYDAMLERRCGKYKYYLWSIRWGCHCCFFSHYHQDAAYIR